jgi:hypothetical protein
METSSVNLATPATVAARACVRLQKRLAAVVSSCLLVACGGSGESGPRSDAVAASEAAATAAATTATAAIAVGQEEAVFVGQAHTFAYVTDVYGNQFLKYYPQQIAVWVLPPRVAQISGQREDNPFHFLVGPPDNSVNSLMQEGVYTINSAVISYQGYLSHELLVKHWHMAWDGFNFTGVLLDPGNALALTSNLINLPAPLGGGIWYPNPYGMAPWTKVFGTMTADEIRFRLEGNTLDFAHPFASEVAAARLR